MLMLDLVTAKSTTKSFASTTKEGSGSSQGKYKSVSAVMNELDPSMVDRYESLRAYLLALGDDVQETILAYYIAFKRIKNFACVEFRPSNGKILVYTKVRSDKFLPKPSFIRDVRTIGHFGTGSVEISLSTADDLEHAKPMIKLSYDNS